MRHWITLIESSQFPILNLEEVFHVGSMDATDKRNDSYEGAGLSISLHPNAWRAIARGSVGGNLWRLTNESARFLDYHELNKPQRQEIVSWGMTNGYVVTHESYEVSYYDEELERRVAFHCDTPEEAESELEEYEDLEGKIEKLTDGYIMTPKLQARCNLQGSHYVNCLDLLCTVFADDVLGLDGIWWEDDFDPDNLSAPRGVIFPRRLDRFTIERVGDEEAPDEEY